MILNNPYHDDLFIWRLVRADDPMARQFLDGDERGVREATAWYTLKTKRANPLTGWSRHRTLVLRRAQYRHKCRARDALAASCTSKESCA